MPILIPDIVNLYSVYILGLGAIWDDFRPFIFDRQPVSNQKSTNSNINVFFKYEN